MKKIGLIVLAFASASYVFCQEGGAEKPENPEKNYDYSKNFFLDAGLLYNFENVTGDDGYPSFLSHNLGMEFGLGYDFGRITARFYFEYNFLLGGTAYWSNGTNPITTNLDSSKTKLGLEAGIKLYNGTYVDFIIPLGFLFNWTEYKQKNPSYTTDNYPYDREWHFDYINIFSGFGFSLEVSKHIKVLFLSNIGFPFYKNYEYEEELRSGYWTSTGTSTYSEECDMKIPLEFSAGFGLRFNF